MATQQQVGWLAGSRLNRTDFLVFHTSVLKRGHLEFHLTFDPMEGAMNKTIHEHCGNKHVVLDGARDSNKMVLHVKTREMKVGHRKR